MSSLRPLMILWHSRRSCTPAYVWIALSMHPWQGTKHLSMPLFAALTIAPQRSVVMSPFHRAMPSRYSRSSASVTPRLESSLPR